MRGLYSSKTKIRHQIFTEIARLAYEGDIEKEMDDLPYKILPGEIATYRDSIFLERAIVGERLRLAMGLPCRNASEHAPVSDNIEAADRAETYYTPPLINVIKFACNACKEKRVHVTDGCQGCLAHPCVEVCPKGAVTLDRTTGRSHIDEDKCIKCGKCKSVCPYDAISKKERPCAKACGVNAIESDKMGRAYVNPDKCVSCGMCMVSCPFGAIADKSQIFQLIRCMKNGGEVVAEIAPAYAGQFGKEATPDKIYAALLKLGFSQVYEVALGADIGAVTEAHDYVYHV